jgi:NAD(P)-dependent dehydrogenase (short-subunit alcohol dehydrogenase family)
MSRYHDSHAKPNGPGDARPTALQIIQDEGLVNKLTDKVMLVTGSSSGIGVETVAALHATGATVFATARDMTKGQKVIDEIMARDTSNKAPIHLIKMELDSLESVREGAKTILSKTEKMNVAIFNAGVWFPNSSHTIPS